jgi:hypothetical protein|tara:strand:+ start:230 stop:505 length:276 start_codon:yes stop_codon:yes gene_type:complete
LGINNIIPLVPDLRTTNSVSFNKVDKSKFSLTRETMVTDHRIGKIISSGSSDLGLYEITTGDIFDESAKYEDIDGNIAIINFIKVDKPSES